MKFETHPRWAKTALQTEISLSCSPGQLKNASENPIICIGGVHGDEPEGVRLAEDLLHWLESAENKQVAVPWIVVPCLNIDGFRAQTRVNGRGVDLNRNYPSKNWQPDFEKPRYNPGPSAGSEPEVQALIQLFHQQRPRLVIHFHSWEPCIVYTGDPGKLDAERLAKCSGYEARTEIGYPTTGSLSQYGWIDNQIPIICIEEQEGAALDTVWSHFGEGLKAIFADPSMRR